MGDQEQCTQASLNYRIPREGEQSVSDSRPPGRPGTAVDLANQQTGPQRSSSAVNRQQSQQIAAPAPEPSAAPLPNTTPVRPIVRPPAPRAAGQAPPSGSCGPPCGVRRPVVPPGQLTPRQTNQTVEWAPPPGPRPRHLIAQEALPPPQRLPPPDVIPAADVPIPDCYQLPQDDSAAQGDWSQLARRTGIRPAVTSFSISRYSVPEWRAFIDDKLNNSIGNQEHAGHVRYRSKRVMQEASARVDAKQLSNTEKLGQRSRELHFWRTELEREARVLKEEMELLSEQQKRLERALGAMRIPQHITDECVERRTRRNEPDLVRDRVEMALLKEAQLIRDVQQLLERTIEHAAKQQAANRAARDRVEFDWSDKKMAYEIDSHNTMLKNTSTNIIFRPGATRFSDYQSTPKTWEEFTRDNLAQAERERLASANFRDVIEEICTRSARDLREQADEVELELVKRIEETYDACRQLENHHKQVLYEIGNTEKTIDDLRRAILNMDPPMKEAQTRLDNRLHRPRVENCRDESQYGLVEEVRDIDAAVSALKAQLAQTEEALDQLVATRRSLEEEIAVKRKTLQICKGSIQRLRSHYPSTVFLSGY